MMFAACNNCGNAFEVAAGTRFAVCAKCGVQLAIEEAPGAVVTRVLQHPAIDAQTPTPAQQVEQLTRELAHVKRSQRIAELDLEWQRREDGYRSSRYRTLPSETGSLVGYLAAGFGVIWILAGLTINPITALPGIVVVITGIIAGLIASSQYKSYMRSLNHYKAQRQQLVRELESAGQ
ncbi:MAG TPA: hypothetical protein VHM90_04620 [Phycisphaerae bacterium]|jgi:hypothetical protein|nr:hypothetical protein [Phycisphaerae bacterium]